MYCPRCGVQLAEGSTYCTSCGANLAQPPPVYPSNPPYGPAPYNPVFYQQKSGVLALVLAFIIPGAGHLYAGKFIRGIIFMASFYGLGILTFLGWWAIFVSGSLGGGWSLLGFSAIMIILAFVVWVFNMIDAYSVTKKYNAELVATGRAPW